MKRRGAPRVSTRTARHDQHVAGDIIQNSRGDATQKSVHQAGSSVRACYDKIGIGFIRQDLESSHRVPPPGNDFDHGDSFRACHLPDEIAALLDCALLKLAVVISLVSTILRYGGSNA